MGKAVIWHRVRIMKMHECESLIMGKKGLPIWISKGRCQMCMHQYVSLLVKTASGCSLLNPVT